MASVDASNACIPLTSPLSSGFPPLPSTARGEPCVLDGKPGRYNGDRSLLVYGSGRLVVVRDLEDEKKTFVYRGHVASVTAVKFSPSGCYVASGDVRGKLRVWSYDNEEHLCKLENQALTGPIRDIAWDMDSKRIALVGERADASSPCCRVIQWDTGVTCGDLGQHTRGRATSCDFKPNRPMRIVTAGKDDSRVYINQGPPFKRIVDGKPSDAEHAKGAVNCVRYNREGTQIASVGADKTVCLYDGKTMELSSKLENVHSATIYSCAWSSKDSHVLTCSADGTAKLLSAEPLQVVHTWNVAELLSGRSVDDKVPIGGMQVGCAFIKNDVPVCVGINGEIALLPKPAELEDGIADFKKLTGHIAPIAGMVIDSATNRLFTADTDGVVCSFDIALSTALTRYSRTEDMLGKIHGGAAISGITIVASKILTCGWDDTIRMASPDGVVLDQTIVLEAQPNAIHTGTSLTVVVTVGGLVLIQNGSTVKPTVVIDYNALCVAVSSDDSFVYVGGEDCKIRVYSVSGDSLDLKHTIGSAHLKPVHALSISNDGTKLASADVRDICVWNIAENYSAIVGKSRWCFHTQRITCLSWSPDDTVLASGGADDSIFLWSLTKKMKRLHYSFSHRGGVTGLQFLKAGWTLVSVGNDGCINQWDLTEDVARKFG